MPKTNITLYSSTPSENTDIDDINIDELCPASNLNNALRSLLSHLKNVDTGSQALTALSVTGNVTVAGDIQKTSGNLTIDVDGQLVVNSDSGQVVLQDDTVNWGNLQNSSGDFVIESLGTDKDIIFKGLDGSSTIEVARLDMSAGGTLLIGKDTNTANVVGTEIEGTGTIVSTRDGNTNIFLNRKTSNGNFIDFRKDNSTVGVVGTNGSFYLGSGDTGVYFYDPDNAIIPCDPSNGGTNRDNAIDLGYPSVRFDDVRATNGTIQTSDRNEKQDIEELSETEKRVAVVAKGLMRKFRWKDKVAEKGDNARIHFGIIAQDLEDAFKAEGLDASKYAMFCSDTWFEKEISVDAVEADEENGIEAKDAYTYMDIKDETTEGYTEKTRLGVRYSELLAFIISAI
nr:Endo-N-acetylneuraminidase [uncultured Mediterranean phage uvMED]